MLANLFETHPGRVQEFFKLLRYIALLLMGPTSALQHRIFENAVAKQAAMAAMAIYAEAVLESLYNLISTVRFLTRYRGRHRPRAYTRRLRALRSPACVGLRRADTGVQVIRGWGYVLVCVVAVVIAVAISFPVVFFDIYGLDTDAEAGINAASLFLLITLGTGGNFLAGAIFLIERFDIEGLAAVQGTHVRVVIPVLYSFWFLFESVATVARVWVMLNDDPVVRALAGVYLFRMDSGRLAALGTDDGGAVDIGGFYVGLEESAGTVKVIVSGEPCTQEISLEEVLKIA